MVQNAHCCPRTVFIFNCYKKTIYYTCQTNIQIDWYWTGCGCPLDRFFSRHKNIQYFGNIGHHIFWSIICQHLGTPVLSKKMDWLEFLIGVFIVLGIYLIFSFEINYKIGIMVALAATILATIFTILNKKYTTRFHPTLISFYEMIGGFMGISIYLLVTNGFSSSFFLPTISDISYLLILGLVCTAFAFALSVDVMKELSAYTVILSINMEPIYGILLAFFIFGESERMSGGFYAGTMIILASVFLFPIIKRKRKA